MPSGTVTFLFTDLEGSTRLWEEFPEAMRGALARHDELLRGAVEELCGTPVKTTGDGLHAVFDRADTAIGAAVLAQRRLGDEPWPETGQLRVRMAVHAGVAERRGGDYYGPALNRAARLMGVAHGGQVVCSQAAAELVVDAPPAGVELVDLGEHRLRDLARVERVFQIWAPGLQREFPPLESIDEYPGNLPFQVTSFVGRDEELAAVAKLLEGSRLVTLVGPGGVGKTRLAVQTAAECVSRYRDGTWFVDLAPINDESLVSKTVAAGLGLAEPQQGSVNDALIRWLADRYALLILDNCEHVMDATTELVQDLVGRCRTTTMLATSREALGLSGETIYPVRPLSVPPAGSDDLPATEESSAARLFADRAAAGRHGFSLRADNAGAIAELCRRLDGIPLALELAAARVQSMSPADILERLDERFRLLAQTSRRGGLSRHQTLQAAVDWSYELLDRIDQRVFAQMAVFAGGFLLDAAEAVASCDGVTSLDVVDAVGRLVARSLLTVDDAGSSTRYRLLETLREYAWERLVDDDMLTAARERHAGYYLALAERAAPELLGPDDRSWTTRLEDERDNLYAALEWAELVGDAVTFVRMALALANQWWHTNEWQQHYRYFEKAVAQATVLPPSQRAEMLAHYGHVAIRLSRYDEGRHALQTSLELSAAQGESPQPLALLTLATDALESGRAAEAIGLAQQAADAAQTRNERFWHGYALAARSVMISSSSDEDALPMATQALSVAQDLGNEWLIATALFAAGEALVRVDPAQAISLLDQALALSAGGDQYTGAQAMFFRGIAHLRARQIPDAAHDLREALARMQALGGEYYAATVLSAIASLLALQNQPEDAVRLLGALDGSRERWGIPGAPNDLNAQQRLRDRLERTIDHPKFAQLWTEARAWTIDETVRRANAAIADLSVL